MKDYHPLHVNITDEVKKIIKEHRIVFPAYYGQIYNQVAKKNGVELSPSELLHHEMLDEKVIRHIISLSEHTQSALLAMETKNESKLQEVIEETKKLQEEIEELQQAVYQDTLTKCYNRKWFEDKYLDINKEKFTKNGTLVFVDLNRLKRINDAYGHVVGDKVIEYFAKKLKEITPNVVRYGGDEFLLLFDKKDTDNLIQEKIDSVFNFFENKNFKYKDVEFKVTFAYGKCKFHIDDLFINIVEQADKMMYIFKEGRRQKTTV